jgi:hypothetical protein
VAGYTPIFDSVFQGSLCGKYPDLPVWLVLLALQQRGGIIDAHPSYIAMISGIPQEDIEKAIAHFCLPDPSSRTPDHDGRRLEPIEGRGFGWRVLNHEKYRAMARRKEYDDKRTESGADAERKAASRRVPTCPDESRQVPLSEAEAEAIKNTDVPSGDVVRVFGHWQTVHGKARAKLDDKRKRLIRAALKIHSADDLCRCISGYKRSPFHQGKNDRGVVYDDIGLMLRDAKQIEQGIAHSETTASEVVRWR